MKDGKRSQIGNKALCSALWLLAAPEMQTLGVLTYPALSITGRIAATESLPAVIDTINHLLQHRAKRSFCCCPNSPIQTTHNFLTWKLHAWMSLCRVQYTGVQTAGLGEKVRVEKCNRITCLGQRLPSPESSSDLWIWLLLRCGKGKKEKALWICHAWGIWEHCVMNSRCLVLHKDAHLHWDSPHRAKHHLWVKLTAWKWVSVAQACKLQHLDCIQLHVCICTSFWFPLLI